MSKFSRLNVKSFIHSRTTAGGTYFVSFFWSEYCIFQLLNEAKQNWLLVSGPRPCHHFYPESPFSYDLCKKMRVYFPTGTNFRVIRIHSFFERPTDGYIPDSKPKVGHWWTTSGRTSGPLVTSHWWATGVLSKKSNSGPLVASHWWSTGGKPLMVHWWQATSVCTIVLQST